LYLRQKRQNFIWNRKGRGRHGRRRVGMKKNCPESRTRFSSIPTGNVLLSPISRKKKGGKKILLDKGGSAPDLSSRLNGIPKDMQNKRD